MWTVGGRVVVEFIAHAGFSLREDGYEILIDPWFYSSTPDYPVIESLLPPHRSIDFQTPATQRRPHHYRPNAILISHFHSHHSPRRDIQELCWAQECVALLYPTLDPRQQATLSDYLQAQIPHARPVPVAAMEMVEMGPFKVHRIFHPHDDHASWLVTSRWARFLHVADAPINRYWHERRVDRGWRDYAGLQPDWLVVSAGGHSQIAKERRAARQSGGAAAPGDADAQGMLFHHHGIMDSLEACSLAELLRPKLFSLMGYFNHSFFRNNHEFVLPSHVVEEQLEWGKRALSPGISVTSLHPGLAVSFEPKTKNNGTQEVRDGAAL